MNYMYMYMDNVYTCMNYMYMYMDNVYLLDITKQQCCIEWFVSCLYNYIYVHFPEGVPIIPSHR